MWDLHIEHSRNQTSSGEGAGDEGGRLRQAPAEGLVWDLHRAQPKSNFVRRRSRRRRRSSSTSSSRRPGMGFAQSTAEIKPLSGGAGVEGGRRGGLELTCTQSWQMKPQSIHDLVRDPPQCPTWPPRLWLGSSPWAGQSPFDLRLGWVLCFKRQLKHKLGRSTPAPDDMAAERQV